MAVHPEKGNLIYHITAIDNFAGILKNGLKPRSDVQTFINVADKDIIRHRKKHNLNNRVPFHFLSSSPFAGKIQELYPETDFVYITLSRTTAAQKNFKILVQHPLSLNECILHDYIEGMQLINWELMGQRDYSNKACKHVCMAECLYDKTIGKQNEFWVNIQKSWFKK